MGSFAASPPIRWSSTMKERSATRLDSGLIARRPTFWSAFEQHRFEPRQPLQHKLDPGIIHRDDRDRAGRLEMRPFHSVDMLYSGTMYSFVEILRRYFFRFDCRLVNLAVLNQHAWNSFQNAGDVLLPVCEIVQRLIGRKERHSSDQTAEERIILTDDRVLHGIREQEQNGQIKRINLGQLAPSKYPEHQNEKEINNNRPNHLFKKRHRHTEHVAPDFMEHHRSPSRDGSRQKSSAPDCSLQTVPRITGGCNIPPFLDMFCAPTELTRPTPARFVYNIRGSGIESQNPG